MNVLGMHSSCIQKITMDQRINMTIDAINVLHHLVRTMNAKNMVR